MITTLVAFINSGLLAAFVLGKFWKGSTWQGAVGAIIAGVVTSGAVLWIPALTEFWERPAIPAVLAAFATCFIVSKLTYAGEKPSVAEVAKQFELERVPIGTIMGFATNDVEDAKARGWLPCDGTQLTGAYKDLEFVLAKQWGTYGSLPNLKSVFLRGWSEKVDELTDPDAPRAPGHFQNDALKKHRHEMPFDRWPV